MYRRRSADRPSGARALPVGARARTPAKGDRARGSTVRDAARAVGTAIRRQERRRRPPLCLVTHSTPRPSDARLAAQIRVVYVHGRAGGARERSALARLHTPQPRDVHTRDRRADGRSATKTAGVPAGWRATTATDGLRRRRAARVACRVVVVVVVRASPRAESPPPPRSVPRRGRHALPDTSLCFGSFWTLGADSLVTYAARADVRGRRPRRHAARPVGQA